VSTQDRQYEQAASEYGPALLRLARGYEADSEKRRDLIQEIHLALWRSFASFSGNCSIRTWVYRVAHNTGATWVLSQKRSRQELLVGIEELEATPVPPDMDRAMALARLMGLIHRLNPLDRQVILAWLEGMDAASISDLTGLSAGSAATRIHRIKSLLAQNFHEGKCHAK
jgi:RNA polymerase sigma-70 factor (ECF subfamily)